MGSCKLQDFKYKMPAERALPQRVKICTLALIHLIVQVFFIQRAECYYNETKFKQIVLHDRSNDDAIKMSTIELIVRSGFRYREYHVVGHDGYITQLINMINPKADPKMLKKPPVLLLHGSHLDSSIYVISSSIQHHPEPYPRRECDGMMSSANRSIAFTLANNGFDVWLVGGRGSNPPNSGWTHRPKFYQAQHPNFKPTKKMRLASYSPLYWNYDLDAVIKNELPVQIEFIKNVTGTREFHYFSFSLSTATTMAYLGENPEVAKTVRSYVQMAPIIAASHFTHAGRYYWEKIAPYLPNRGIGFGPSYFFDDFLLKNAVLFAAQSDHLRFSVLTDLNRSLFGPSPAYHTWLERNIIHHIIQPVSFKSAQQYAQASRFGKFRYYDYGFLGNLFKYNSTTPPEHKVDTIDVQNYLIISGSLDCLADPLTIQRIKELTKTKRPVNHIIAPGFNHLDLIAAVENDVYVNRPLVEFFNKHSDIPKPSKISNVKECGKATDLAKAGPNSGGGGSGNNKNNRGHSKSTPPPVTGTSPDATGPPRSAPPPPMRSTH